MKAIVAADRAAGRAGMTLADFVVEADRVQPGEIVRRVRDGRLRTNVGATASLDDAVAALTRPNGLRGRQSFTLDHREKQPSRV